MANSLSINQSVSSVIDGVRTTLSSNTTQNTTSSNFIAGGQDVGSAGWTSLSLGSLTNVLGLTVLNDNTGQYTASVVTIATGSAGLNIIGYLYPGGQLTTQWSGSLSGLYAMVTSGVNLPPAGVPPSASVQWLVQQS